MSFKNKHVTYLLHKRELIFNGKLVIYYLWDLQRSADDADSSNWRLTNGLRLPSALFEKPLL